MFNGAPMADRRQQHRPHRLSVPPRSAASTTTTTSRAYPLYPYPSPTLTPTPTPSKHRLSHSLSSRTPGRSSLSFVFLLLFSLPSLYSLLPFLRASPAFSLFPFAFLVSLLSFLLTLFFSFIPFHSIRRQPGFFLSSLTPIQVRHLLFKSLLLAVVFLLRFQALRYCGTAAMILAEFSGNIAFLFVTAGRKDWDRDGSSKVRGCVALLIGLLLLSVSWDRMDCFPLSYSNIKKLGTTFVIEEKCLRIGPMLLPFLSGLLGCYESDSTNWGTIRALGRERVRLFTLFLTTVLLFFPAIVNMLIFEAEGGSVSILNLGWLLANTVLFGVLLNEWHSDEKWMSPRDFEKEFFITFVCTLVLELVYYPELSLWGLLICGLLLWIAVRQLNCVSLTYVELGMKSSETLSSMVMKPIRHILSERKSRKIALFLMINTGYMVVEFVAGFMSNSLGLISDACHMLFDCAALGIGLYASYISRLPANSQFNYGRGRFEVLSGYVNAVFLVLVGALIVLESLERILDPQEISTSSLLAVSVGGLVVNIVGLIFFHEEHHHAHGGSCSHSHPHSHSDHIHDSCHDQQHSHDHFGHAHISKSEPHDGISVFDEKCGSHHDHHDGNHHSHMEKHVEDRKTTNIKCGHYHGHAHLHNHHEHHHDHGCQHHDHHHLAHDVLQSSHHNDTTVRHLHRHIDHNMEGIFLHVLADTMGSVGVVISTLLIKYKGWLIADPACSIFISVLIVSSVIPLLRNSGEILLQRVPRAHEQDIKKAMDGIMKIKGVFGIQNLHIWSLTNIDVIGTLHLHVSSETDKVAAKTQVSKILRDVGVKDLTIQVECVNSN